MIMTDDRNDERPRLDEYLSWYEEQFGDDLNSEQPQQWYQKVTDVGRLELERSEFWKQLQGILPQWDSAFRATHDNYELLAPDQPENIRIKTFDSAIIKAFRLNVLDNEKWPDPPAPPPSTGLAVANPTSEDVRRWFGPHNWLTDFHDIFRTRLVAFYFDGVKHLAERVKELAQQTTTAPTEFRMIASPDGYHAAHLVVQHELTTFEYDTGDLVPVPVRLEIQVTTAIQANIIDLLHRVYEDWRVNGRPPAWQWDYESPAFAVNYLGTTLHYLEAMIVIARDKGRNI